MNTAATLGAALAAVFLALAGAAAADLAGRPRLAHALRLLGCLAAAGFAGAAVGAGPVGPALGPWMQVGGASLGFGLRGDGTAAAALGASVLVGLLYPLAQPAMDGAHRALLTVAAMGVALLSCAADWLPLLLGWEIAVAALLVTASRSGDVSEAGARCLLLLTRIGSVALMAGAAASLAGGGPLEGISWNAEPAAGLLILAAVIGLGAWPLHQWILEASSCPASGAAASVLAVAGASLLSRVGPLAGPLQEVVLGVGSAAAVAASAAALASYGLRGIPGWIAVAQSGLVAAAAAADPIAGWLVLGAALGARLCLAAGIGLVRAALPAVERLDQLGGLGGSLPAARWMCLAAVLIPVLSLAGLWGQALLLKHAFAGYGSPGMVAVLGLLALAVLPVGRLAFAPFAVAIPRPDSKMVRTALPITAGSVSAALVFAVLPALSWLRLPAPPMDGLGLAAAANAAALGISVLVWRRGLKPASGPPSAARRLAAGGLGAGAVQQRVAGAGISLGRGLWTFVDGAVLGAAWGALGLVLRGAGWALARAEHANRGVWAAALAAGAGLVVLWSMGGR